MPDSLTKAADLVGKMQQNVKNQDLHTTSMQLYEVCCLLCDTVTAQAETIEQLQAKVLPPAAPEANMI